MTEQVKTAAETGFLTKIQPWQSLFGLLSAAFAIYGIDDYKALIFYGMIMVCLGFVMVSSHKNKEKMKEVIIPFVIARALEAIEGYVKTNSIEVPAEPDPVEPEPEEIVEPPTAVDVELNWTREQHLERLKEMDLME